MTWPLITLEMPLRWLDKLLHHWGPELQRNSDQDFAQVLAAALAHLCHAAGVLSGTGKSHIQRVCTECWFTSLWVHAGYWCHCGVVWPLSECANGASKSTLNLILAALDIDTIVRSNRTGPGQRGKREFAWLLQQNVKLTLCCVYLFVSACFKNWICWLVFVALQC